MKAPASIVAIGTFLIHVIAVGIAFIVVFLVALGLNYFAAWLEGLKTLPDFFITAVYWLEWFLFFVDITCFVIVILIEGWSLITEIWTIHKNRIRRR